MPAPQHVRAGRRRIWVLAVCVAVAIPLLGGTAFAVFRGSDDNDPVAARARGAVATTSAVQPGGGSDSDEKRATPGDPTDGPKATAPAEREALFEDALDGSAAVTCTFSIDDSSGTVDIHGRQRFRVDVTDAESRTWHILKRDETGYLWGGGMAEGVSFDGSPEGQLGEVFAGLTPGELADEGDGAKVACSAYSGGSAFEVPDLDFKPLPSG